MESGKIQNKLQSLASEQVQEYKDDLKNCFGMPNMVKVGAEIFFIPT